MKTIDYQGLNEQEVLESRKKFGENTLTPPKRKSAFSLFLEKFDDPVIKILIIAAIISLGIGFFHNDFTEAIGIIIAIILATGIGFWFEYDARKKFDILNLVNDETPVKVIRNNRITEVPKKDVVVGDIVILNTGDEVPADGEILDSVNLSVNESSLTGEMMVEKSADPQKVTHESTYPANKLFKGCTVIDGNAVMKVTAVGDNTEYGKLAFKSGEETETKTPLNEQLDKLAKLIGFVGFSFSVIVFIVLFTKNLIIGNLQLSLSQLYLVLSIFLVLTIFLSKIWVPILYDGLKIIFKRNFSHKFIEHSSSIKRVTIAGVLILLFLIITGYIIGVNPLDSNSWINLDQASMFLEYFMISVTIVVVSIPEGLPMSVTLSLALSMRRMLKSKNLVRKMHATETMGAVTVICTDKTGTLTKNEMNVFDIQFFSTNSVRNNSEQSKIIIESMAVNSTANLDFSEKISKPIGNPTESALLKFLFDNGINYLDVRKKTEILDQLSFSTERKYMATLAYSEALNKKILYVKGAPEIVLGLSTKVLTSGNTEPLSNFESTIKENMLRFQNKGMRTLGFAYKIIEDDSPVFSNSGLVCNDLIYLGLVAISDPVREDVSQAITDCISAGVKVIMVTGDIEGTAKEIARQSGIINYFNKNELVLSGKEFESMSDEEIINILPNLKILCRAKPGDKQRLVTLLQKTGEIVAVTGDGTNDAPALNHAHVGLAMGSGTAVAKEAGDIVIMDDSFSTIVSAIMWGRSLYKNIQKFLVFQLIINFSGLIIVLFGSILGHEIPLTVTQMLWINIIMDTFAAAALASLPPDKKVLQEKPRKNSDFIITKKMKNAIIGWGSFFVIALFTLHHLLKDAYGDISLYNLTIFFTVFVMMQFWNLFNVKSFGVNRSAFYQLSKSKAFLLVAALIIVGQIIIVELGGAAFRTVPLNIADFIIIIISTSPILFIPELLKLISPDK
ncbi:MAG: calcium-translocating P-type ATPase, PMCA-type [Bacteroidales bacterium]|jgi:Ca2+-transporting ATPase